MADETPGVAVAPVDPPIAGVLAPDGERWSGSSDVDVAKAQAVAGFRTTGTIRGAAMHAQRTYQTVRKWLFEDEAFREAVLLETDYIDDELEELAIARAKGGDNDMLKFLLRARRARYKDKVTIEVVSPDVQRRLQLQADAIVAECSPEVASRLANRLREIWAAA